MWDAERTLAYFVYLPGTHTLAACLALLIPCVATRWGHLPNARPMRTPRLTPRLTQVSRPTVHIPFTAPPSS